MLFRDPAAISRQAAVVLLHGCSGVWSNGVVNTAEAAELVFDGTDANFTFGGSATFTFEDPLATIKWQKEDASGSLLGGASREAVLDGANAFAIEAGGDIGQLVAGVSWATVLGILVGAYAASVAILEMPA